jgi:hypothetical protein
MVMKATVTGEQRTIALLKAFDKDAYNDISKAFKAAGEVVRNEARSNTPAGNALSNWGKWIAVDRGIERDLGFTGSRVRRRINVNLSQDRRNWGDNLFMVRIVTMDPGGAIFTLSGSKQKRRNAEIKTGYRGISFTKNLNDKFLGEKGKFPRGLLAAVQNRGPEVRPRLEEVMADATARANRIINRGA